MMKKSLIALAIAGVVAAPAAFAEAKISGSISVMATKYEKNSTNVDQKTMHIEDGNTFIKITGSEDLGGGMSATYGMDFGVDVSGHSGSDDVNLQNAVVGVKSSFGTVIAGSFDNPMKVMGGAYELFGNQPGDRRALTNQGYAEARSDNVIAYLSPDFNGVTFAIASFNPNVVEENRSGDDATMVYKVQYANGPLNAGVAYHASEQGANDEKATRIAASYKLGDTKFNVMWTDVANAGGSSTADSKTLVLGVAHTMGPITLKLQRTALDSAVVNSDSALIAVGVDYALSKSTKVFAHYAKLDNKSAATNYIKGWTGADFSAATTADADPTAIGVGIRHNF